VYFQGTLQGMEKKEIDTYLPTVLEFADIGEFIDQPVKLYSSGMYVRLAFSAAIQGDPDILIVDEALAVGDVRFQRKCFQYIETLKQRGTTFIFVSHTTEQIVTHCTRALLLAGGCLLLDDEPRVVANCYMDMLFGREKKIDSKVSDEIQANAALNDGDMPQCSQLAAFLQNADTRDRFAENSLYNPYEYRWGDGRAAILDAHLASLSGNPQEIHCGDKLCLHIKGLFKTHIHRPKVAAIRKFAAILFLTMRWKPGALFTSLMPSTATWLPENIF
jgi:lipopolysaccharide transport system ATP-binding protein